MDRYQHQVRPDLVVGREIAHLATLFLTHTGEPFTPNRLTQLVRRYVQAAELGKSGSCHLFRHTMATLMLENGADIRYIQAMLGHAELSTTQIYTQVSIRKLKQIHTATHPGRLRESAQAILALSMMSHRALRPAPKTCSPPWTPKRSRRRQRRRITHPRVDREPAPASGSTAARGGLRRDREHDAKMAGPSLQ